MTQLSYPPSYVMTSLKMMAGTEEFLAMPDNKKNCQREEFEECREKRFMETVKRECGCIPWGLEVVNHGVEVTLSY